jgi:ABC-2 type transport system permease protein
MPSPGLRATLVRECQYLRQPWEQALLIWFPAATMALVLWLFSSGIPVGLPIAVVDEDHSSASRELVRRITAMRSLHIAAQPSSLQSSWPLVRSGGVYGVVHVPPGWERDRLRGAPQPVVLYDNTQFFLVAGIVSSDVRSAVASMAFERAVASEARFGGGFAQAASRVNVVQADLRTVFNPTLSYEAYLAGMLLPAVLHLFAVLAAVSALGREFRDRTVNAWLASADGSLTRALLGKLAPVLVVYVVLALMLIAVLAGWRGWNAAGSLVLWYGTLVTLMVVSIAVAVLFVGATSNLRTALSLTGIYVATALAFSGFSYPLVAMNEPARWWSSLLPFTYYLPLQQGQWMADASLAAWARGMLPLLLFTLIPLLAGLPLLARAVRNPSRWGAR